MATNFERHHARMERMQGEMSACMAKQLAVQENNLAVNSAQLGVQTEMLQVNKHQLSVQTAQLGVNQDQLVEAMRTVSLLNVTNDKLGSIEDSLADINGVLVAQSQLLSRSLKQLEARSQELIERGIEAYCNGWLSEAQADLVKAIELNPYMAPAHYYLAKCQHLLGATDEALRSYEKCVYYGRVNAPIFECYAYCDLVSIAAESDTNDAQSYLRQALNSGERANSLVALSALDLGIASGGLTDSIRLAITEAFKDRDVDPEVFLAALKRKASGSSKTQSDLNEAIEVWERQATIQSWKRNRSEFHRELSDFCYLAPLVRGAFRTIASGAFESLGHPLAQLMDWSVDIAKELLKGIEHFNTDSLPILKTWRYLQGWNRMLSEIHRRTNQLDQRAHLFSGGFVQKLNMGLIDVARAYEDDKIVFEINVNDERKGDTLALSCYYAIIVRDGVETFTFPLADFHTLDIETYPSREGQHGLKVTHKPSGQVLVQGNAGMFDTSPDPVPLTKLFQVAGTTLAEIHQQFRWAMDHENELVSLFVVLEKIAEAMYQKRLEASGTKTLGAPPSALPPGDDDIEIIDDDDDFEVVNDDDDDFEVL